jgi:hypothetical protein
MPSPAMPRGAPIIWIQSEDVEWLRKREGFPECAWDKKLALMDKIERDD